MYSMSSAYNQRQSARKSPKRGVAKKDTEEEEEVYLDPYDRTEQEKKNNDCDISSSSNQHHKIYSKSNQESIAESETKTMWLGLSMVFLLLAVVTLCLIRDDDDIPLDHRSNIRSTITLFRKISPYLPRILSIVIYVLVPLVLIDWIAKISGHKELSSTHLLDYLSEIFASIFRKIGRWIAVFSSFYIYLHLGDLVESIVQVSISILWIIFTWIAIFDGYRDALNRLYNKRPHWVMFGTLTIGMVIILGGVYLFRVYY